ncbi:N-acetyltransferase 9-like protein [Anthophora plagiata]
MKCNEFTQIIGRNVILVPYKEKHVKRYHEWMKSAELQYFTGSETLTIEKEFEMQKQWLQDEDKCTFIILEKSVFTETGDEIEAMIGDTNLFFNESDQPNSAEVEIMIADVTYRGKKRGWEATIIMLLYGIDTLNVTKYTAKIKFDNEKSITMFKKLGFHEIKPRAEGTNRTCYKLQRIMSVSRILQKLKRSTQKRPLLFNSVIYGSFYTGAEFAQQTYAKIFKFPLSPISADTEDSTTLEIEERSLFFWRKKLNEKLGLLDEDSSRQFGGYNWAQLKRYAIYGCFIAGPLLHGWYKWLDEFYKGKRMKTVLTKLLVDQFVLTPPLITVFFISMSLMESKLNVFDECKAKFVQTFKVTEIILSLMFEIFISKEIFCF